MTIELDRLARALDPNNTVLFFGAGSSIPSGMPSAAELAAKIGKKFSVATDGFNLSEVSQLTESAAGREELISFVRGLFPKAHPTGGLMNVPLYDWKSIFSTNYDELIETAFRRRKVDLANYTTNFDFSQRVSPTSQRLYKIHGTISQDVVDGSKSRLILTQNDYDKAEEYRDFLFDRLASDMAGSNLVIIGYSLADPDIKSIVDRVLSIQTKMSSAGTGGSIYLVLYENDENRAKLFEARGLRVTFGGIDEFFEAMARCGPQGAQVYASTSDPLDSYPALRATTIDVRHSLDALSPNVSAMFNGWPATYADIGSGLTFTRTVANDIRDAFAKEELSVATLLGASGVGKTTAARQVAVGLEDQGWLCWEHKTDFELQTKEWVQAARNLAADGRIGLLIVDSAATLLPFVNDLADALAAEELKSLRLLLISTRNQWQYRMKATSITRNGREFLLSKLNDPEIDRLLRLVDTDASIRPLVEATFSGFSKHEKRRRLMERCEADTFVCLRNIFATEKFDDIILREYAELAKEDQEIYRLVAAMENAGIRVHRQLVVRLVGIAANKISNVLDNLVDIIQEQVVSAREGVYAWKVRHGVIAGIIARYKFSDAKDQAALFEKVIASISPTYEIERRTINEICNMETGLPSIPDKNVQNSLLRKIISIAPGERVPRHRLIRNLIDLHLYDLAETEIRVFKNDLRSDGPVTRYQVMLLLARGMHTPGILTEDRLVIIRKAETAAVAAVDRYPNSPYVHASYCEVGLEILRRTGDSTSFEEALKELKAAETRTSDKEFTRLVRNFERRRLDLPPVKDLTIEPPLPLEEARGE